MSTIQPPVPLPQPAIGGGAAAVAVVTKVAEGLAKVPIGATLEGDVTAMTGKATLEVRTEAGTLSLRSSFPIPANAKLSLQLMGATADGKPQFRILAINGHSIAGGGAPLAGGMAGNALGMGNVFPPQGQGQAIASQMTANPPQPATINNTAPVTAAAAPGSANPAGGITAQVVATPSGAASGAQGNAQPPPSAGTLPTGTTLVVRLASVQLPQAALPQSAPSQGAAPPQSGLPAAATASPSSTAAPPPSASGGGTLATPQAPNPGQGAAQNQPPPQSAAPPAMPVTLSGVVTANRYGGQPLIQTNTGATLALNTSATLPPGAHVALDVIEMTLPQKAAGAAAARPAIGSASWPNLSRALETLQSIDPQAADQLTKALPQLGPRMALNMMAFAQALKSGDLRQAMGEGPVRALDRAGRKDLTKKLDDEFGGRSSEASKTKSSPSSGEWRALTLPFLDGQNIEAIRLFIRPPPPPEDGDEADKAKEDGSRFLVNVEMSRLGRVQLDGLVRRESKRFDLILRTDAPFSDETRRELAGIFAQSCEISGIAGTVTFQANGRFLEPEDTSGALAGMVV